MQNSEEEGKAAAYCGKYMDFEGGRDPGPKLSKETRAEDGAT